MMPTICSPCFAWIGAKSLKLLRVSGCRNTKHDHGKSSPDRLVSAGLRGLRKGRVSWWTTPEHIEITACFALMPKSRNTPLLCHCFNDVFPCVACVPPKGGRAARNTRAAALPWGAG
jgi:hypothetical protein